MGLCVLEKRGIGFSTRLLAVLLLNWALAHGQKFVFRFQTQGSHFYMVKGFAMSRRYTPFQLPSACHCTRRCQAIPSCHAVSIVPLDGSGVECRTSEWPHNLGNWWNRNTLLYTPDAIHIIQTESNEWGDPELNGLFYHLSGARNQPECPDRFYPAAALSMADFEIILKYLETVAGNRAFIGLSFYENTDTGDFEPYWSLSGSNSSLVHYNDTGLPQSLLNQRYGGSNQQYLFIMQKNADGTEYEFTEKYQGVSYATLCQADKLQLL